MFAVYSFQYASYQSYRLQSTKQASCLSGVETFAMMGTWVIFSPRCQQSTWRNSLYLHQRDCNSMTSPSQTLEAFHFFHFFHFCLVLASGIPPGLVALAPKHRQT
jgi:hypothetical protein